MNAITPHIPSNESNEQITVSPQDTFHKRILFPSRATNFSKLMLKNGNRWILYRFE